MPKLPFAALPAVMLTSCMTPAEPVNDRCPVLDSRDWQAFINAMPGPGPGPQLIVTGTVNMPSPGYRVKLGAGGATKSATPTQTLILRAAPPRGIVAQVVTPTEVRYTGRAIARRYGGVVVRCSGRVLAKIGQIETAY